ncbi:MAG: hypothetical protein HY951_01795 [Bacteroidia bacterium]|nr:hypothetical protein [Bacteroidia bacterium]
MILFSCSEDNKADKNKQKDNKNSEIKTNDESPIKYPLLSYSIIKTRKTDKLKNDSLKTIIDIWLDQNKDAEINEIIDFNLEQTKNILNFTFDKCSSDPPTIIKTGKANCIGYSTLFNSLMNYSLSRKKLNNKYECSHYVGKIFYAGQNINSLFNDPFFKDHDFNVIKNIKNKNNIAVDPSLYEYLGIKRVTVKK